MKKIIIIGLFLIFYCSSSIDKNIVVFYLNQLDNIKNISNMYPDFKFKYIQLSENLKKNSQLLNNTLPNIKNNIAIIIAPDSISLPLVAFFKRENIITFIAGAFNPYFYMLNYKNIFITGPQPFKFVKNMLKHYNKNNSIIISDSSYISKSIMYILQKEKINNPNSKITPNIRNIFWTTPNLKLQKNKKNIILFPSNIKENNIISSTGTQNISIPYPLNYYKITLDILSDLNWQKILKKQEQYILTTKYFNNLHYIK